MSRKISRADQALIDELEKDHGLVVRPRQLERWRQAGMLCRPTVTHLGRGRGTSSAYPYCAAERCIEITGLMAEHRNLRDVLLVLFLRGREVDLEVVRAAYVAQTHDLEDGIREAAALRPSGHPLEDAFDVAEPAALAMAGRASRTPLASPVRRHLRSVAPSVPVDALFTGFLAESFTGFLTGEFVDSSDALTDELKAGTGLTAMEHGMVDRVGPLVPPIEKAEFGATFAAVTSATLEAALADASHDELTQARDELQHLFSMLANMSAAASAVEGERDALGLEIVEKTVESELLMAQIVPAWLVQRRRIRESGVNLAPVFSPETNEGSEQAARMADAARALGDMEEDD
jgi:hypothetical protein